MLKKAFKSLTDSKMTQKSPTRLAQQTKLILCLAILVEHRLLIDRQTDRHGHRPNTSTVHAQHCTVKTL